MRQLGAKRRKIRADRASLAVLTAVLTMALGAEVAMAQGLPNVNLGFTSFLDGAPPAGPGFYFQQYLEYYTSDEFKDDSGDEIPLLGDLDVWISLSQLLYQSDQPVLFGGKWGLARDRSRHSDRLGTGRYPGGERQRTGARRHLDRALHPVGSDHGREWFIFMHRIELQTIFPTGRYRDDRLLNAGSNIFSINPYWAGTLFITQRWEASLRFHYLWNFGEHQAQQDTVPLCGRRPGRPGHPPQLRLVLRGAAEEAPRGAERVLPQADHRRQGGRRQCRWHA